MFQLESGNQNVDRQMADRQTDGCWTHQSNRWVGYMQPAQKYINKSKSFRLDIYIFLTDFLSVGVRTL